MANREIFAPKRLTRVLVFDVETTGTVKKGGAPLDQQPHIIQLSYCIFDVSEHAVVSSFDSYVKIAPEVELSEFICNLTGATREKCNAGKNIIDVLNKFYHAYCSADILVAHNIEFDTQLIMFEIERNHTRLLSVAPYCLSIFNQDLEKVRGMQRHCTMKKNTKFCALPYKDEVVSVITNQDSSSSNLNANLKSMLDQFNVQTTPIKPTIKKNDRFKWPKLYELHEKLFGVAPAVAHNSMADVYATLRCYIKINHHYDVGVLA
jgi:DNA polymerase III epsilon subunit-like protein